MGFGLKKKGTVSALCLTVFGVIGAGAEPLAFLEALDFGANVTGGRGNGDNGAELADCKPHRATVRGAY